MNIVNFFQNKNIQIMVNPDDIKINKQAKTAVDKRSFNKKGMWYVYPVGKDIAGRRIYIVCPYCGKIHSHGNVAGHRVSHCIPSPSAFPAAEKGYVLIIRGGNNTTARLSNPDDI